MADQPKPYPADWDEFKHITFAISDHLRILAEFDGQERLGVTKALRPWAYSNKIPYRPETGYQERIERLCVGQAAFITAQGWVLDPQPFLDFARLISDAYSALPAAPDMPSILSARADVLRLNDTLRAAAIELSNRREVEMVDSAFVPATSRIAGQGRGSDLSPDGPAGGPRSARPHGSGTPSESDEDELADRLSKECHHTKAALVRYMKGRTSADLSEIKDQVQGDPTNRDGAVRGLASKTTQAVRALGSSLEYRVRGHTLRKFGPADDASDRGD